MSSIYRDLLIANTFHEMFIEPFHQGICNIRDALNGNRIESILTDTANAPTTRNLPLSFGARVTALATGILLFVPVINAIALIILRCKNSDFLYAPVKQPPRPNESLQTLNTQCLTVPNITSCNSEEFTQILPFSPPYTSENLPHIFQTTSSLQGFKKFEALLDDNQPHEERELILPTRRVCGFGPFDSYPLQQRAQTTTFIIDSEICKIHPMRFIRKSPFVQPIDPDWKTWWAQHEDNDPMWESLWDGLHKELYAIGRTDRGKHVILQQAVKSCVPACVAMLVLDHGKIPDYKAIKMTCLANQIEAIRWVKNSELNPHVTIIQNPHDALEVLLEAIQYDGPGVLSINHPEIGGHVIVLDHISQEDKTAMIRDSFHGWAVTIKLYSLLSWISQNSYFLQIRSDRSTNP